MKVFKFEFQKERYEIDKLFKFINSLYILDFISIDDKYYLLSMDIDNIDIDKLKSFDFEINENIIKYKREDEYLKRKEDLKKKIEYFLKNS